MAEIGDFCDIVGTKSPVAGLFKFGHVSFFGDSREIYLYVLGIFPKFSPWGPHEPSKMAQNPKSYDFCDIVYGRWFVQIWPYEFFLGL